MLCYPKPVFIESLLLSGIGTCINLEIKIIAPRASDPEDTLNSFQNARYYSLELELHQNDLPGEDSV